MDKKLTDEQTIGITISVFLAYLKNSELSFDGQIKAVMGVLGVIVGQFAAKAVNSPHSLLHKLGLMDKKDMGRA